MVYPRNSGHLEKSDLQICFPSGIHRAGINALDASSAVTKLLGLAADQILDLLGSAPPCLGFVWEEFCFESSFVERKSVDLLQARSLF